MSTPTPLQTSSFFTRTSSSKTQFIAAAGLIAALYVVFTMVSYPLAFNLVQLRLSEALTILPVFMPAAVPGLFVGCALSNLIGAATGGNLLGAWDILLGSMTTLLAALATRALRRATVRGVPVFAVLPPILFNAAVVGAELAYVVLPPLTAASFFTAAAWVGLGQTVVCGGLGLLLWRQLQKTIIKNKAP